MEAFEDAVQLENLPEMFSVASRIGLEEKVFSGAATPELLAELRSALQKLSAVTPKPTSWIANLSEQVKRRASFSADTRADLPSDPLRCLFLGMVAFCEGSFEQKVRVGFAIAGQEALDFNVLMSLIQVRRAYSAPCEFASRIMCRPTVYGQ